MAYVFRITVMSLLMRVLCSSGLVNLLDKKINGIREAIEAEIAFLRHDMGNVSSQLAHLLHGTDGFSSKVKNFSQCGLEKAETGQTGDQFSFNQVIRKGFVSEKQLLKTEVERIQRNVNSTMIDVDRMDQSLTSHKANLIETKSHVKRINDITVDQSRDILAIKEQMESFMTRKGFESEKKSLENDVKRIHSYVNSTMNEVDRMNRSMTSFKVDISKSKSHVKRIDDITVIQRREILEIKQLMESVMTKLDSLNETFKRILELVERDVSASRGLEAKINTSIDADFNKRSENSFEAMGSVRKHGKSIYVRPNRATDYDSATKVCSSLGGYLVEISSEEENAFIKQTFIATSYTLILLGGTDEITEGNWKWAHSGDRIPLRNQRGFQKWARNEPNNRDSNEHCVIMLSNGEWNDNSCQSNFEYVCESDFI